MQIGTPRSFDERKDHKLIYSYWESIGEYLKSEYGYENAYDWKEDIKNKKHTMVFDFDGAPGGILEVRLYDGLDGKIARIYPFSSNPEHLSYISQHGLSFCFTPRENGGLNCKRVQYKEVRVETLVREVTQGEYNAIQQQYTEKLQGEHIVSASDSSGAAEPVTSDRSEDIRDRATKPTGAKRSTAKSNKSNGSTKRKRTTKSRRKQQQVSSELDASESNNSDTGASNAAAVSDLGNSRAKKGRKQKLWTV